jgi:hypothetical protein
MAGPELAALALVALAAAAEPGGDRSPGRGAVCALRVESDSARLEPGDARTVRVRVVAPARPALRASLGQIDEPVADGPGAWAALWRAPLAGPPRVAILTALAVGDCGYTAIPVTGKGVAVVHSRPGARVVVHIGERSFGPILADPEGVALVAVEVPPGVNSVTHGKRVLPLDIPPQAHGAVAFRAEAAAADGEEAVAVMAVAVDDAGGPRTEPPALTASQGTLSGPTPAGPGAWWFTWRLTPGRAGEASLRAQLPGEPAFELRLPRPAGRRGSR